MIAADKIPLENETIKNTVTKAFLITPIFPKTPKFVLAKAFLAHEKVSQNSLDFSLAAQSDDFVQMIGSSIDVQLKGYTDISDPKNPKFDLTGYITKDLNIDIKKNDKIVYIKVNKIPLMLAPMLGVPQEKLDVVTKHWIAYDPTPLDTEAQRQMQELNPPKSATDEVLQGITTNMLDKELLSSITLTHEPVDSFAAYKLEFKPNADQVDKLGDIITKEVPKNSTSSVLGAYSQRLSDYLTDLVITLWVDEKEYYVRKTVTSFTVDPKKAYQTQSYEVLPSDQPALPMTGAYQSPINVVMALQLSDFGKTLPIDTPTESVTPEEFYKILSEEFADLNPMAGASGYSVSRQYSQARDTQRRSDLYAITSAVYQFAAENFGRLPDTDGNITTSNFPTIPTCIGTAPECFDLASAGEGGLTLVPSYLPKMPTDPLTGTESDTGYLIHEDTSGRVVTTAEGEMQPITVTR